MNRHDRSGMMDMGLTATEVWATHKGWDEEMLNDRRRDLRMRNDADALRRSRRNRKRLRDASLTIGILILLATACPGEKGTDVPTELEENEQLVFGEKTTSSNRKPTSLFRPIGAGAGSGRPEPDEKPTGAATFWSFDSPDEKRCVPDTSGSTQNRPERPVWTKLSGMSPAQIAHTRRQ
jgi:hypothetical protein